MKHQIERFAPHQNAKVFAVLMAVSSLVFLVPFFLIALLAAPPEAKPPVWMFVLMPVLYLVIGYLMVAVSCWFYNVMFKYVGGIEFTSTTEST
jgi:hypothetical protein